MIALFLIFISIVVIVLAYLRLLYPYNKISTTISSFIFIIAILMIAVPQPLQTTAVDSFSIRPLVISTADWGSIQSSWNSEKTELNVPINIHGNGHFANNNTRVSFEVKPLPPSLSSKRDVDTIHIEIHNYSARVNKYSLLYKSRGVYYANITDPSGKESGNDYECDYTFKMNEIGTFHIDFKLNSGANDFYSVGQTIPLEITFSDYNSFYRSYKINFICVEL